MTPIWVALDSHFFLMMLRDFSQQQTTLPFFNCQLDIFPTTSNQCSSSVDAQDPPRNVAEAVDPPCHLPIIPKKRPTTQVLQRSRDVSCLRRKGMGNVVLVKVSDSGQNANIKCDVAAPKLINDVVFFETTTK